MARWLARASGKPVLVNQCAVGTFTYGPTNVTTEQLVGDLRREFEAKSNSVINVDGLYFMVVPAYVTNQVQDVGHIEIEISSNQVTLDGQAVETGDAAASVKTPNPFIGIQEPLWVEIGKAVAAVKTQTNSGKELWIHGANDWMHGAGEAEEYAADALTDQLLRNQVQPHRLYRAFLPFADSFYK